MSKYAELDAAIINEIRTGSSQFTFIYRGTVRQLAEIVKPESPWRAVDGRLQALKKAGRIKFVSGGTGWTLTAAEKA